MTEDERDTKDNKGSESLPRFQRRTTLDPVLQEYARKMLGEDCEMPYDYVEMITEARRRGREGLPQPHIRPHRCAEHLQDLIDGIFVGEVWQPMKTFFKCVGSKMGEEPERYQLKDTSDPFRRR
ncbi:hypothetical protein IWW48_003362 [Coemansia sp. RSA 1200]|nr:hypothetical protein IWW48_003362 [Coemansia sp. RSA 1200]